MLFRSAAGIRPDAELRRLAVEALSMYDLADDPRAVAPAVRVGPEIFFDASLDRYATRFSDGRIVVGETRTGRELLALPFGPSHVGYVALSPDGQCLGFREREAVVVWKLRDRREAFRVPVHPRTRGPGFEFHPKHPWLTVNTGTNALKIVELPGGADRELAAIPWNPPYFRAAPGGPRVALLDRSTCTVWDGEGRIEPASLTNWWDITAAEWVPDGSRLALGLATGEIQLWDPASGAVTTLFAEQQGVICLGFESSGSLLMSGHEHHVCALWHVATAQRLSHQLNGLGVRISADGTQVGWLGPNEKTGRAHV